MKMKIGNRLLVILLCLSLLISVLPLGGNFSIEAQAAGYGISNPTINSSGVTTWDCIYFGNYYQSDKTGKTKDPIKWRVLSVNGDDAFLLSEHVLNIHPYNKEYDSITWEDCSLRKWLNNDFYQTAFSSAEQSAVRSTTVVNDDNIKYGTEGGNNTTDKVYALSLSEATNVSYGFSSDFEDSNTRISNYTSYAADQKNLKYIESGLTPKFTVNDGGWWWLRSPGYWESNASIVGYKGHINVEGNYVYNNLCEIRPVLHLDLSSSLWSKAGTVSSTNSEVIPPDPTPAPPDPTPTPPEPEPTPAPGEGGTDNPNPEKETPKAKVTKPEKVSIKSVKSKKKKEAALTWNKGKEAKGYQLQYAVNKKFKKAKSKTTTKTKLTIKKLKRKKTYYFRVRAYKLEGKKKVYGTWSTVRKVRVK